MKWLVLAGLVLSIAKYSNAGALKCAPGVEDASCKTDKQETDTPVHIAEERDVAELAECLEGTEWESNCHTCTCSKSGVAECYRQDNCEMDVFVAPIHCKPNTTFQRDCNTCVCLETGLGLCTLDYCPRLNIHNRADLLEGKECAPFTNWKTRCNFCHCTAKGEAACTHDECVGHESEPDKQCAPDSLWKTECNTCWCTTDGKAMCTKMGCIGAANLNFDDENKTEIPAVNVSETRNKRGISQAQETPKACQPGQEFRMDCNKCLCDNEGQDFSCTRIDCNALNNNNNGGSRRKRETSQKIKVECTPASVFEQGCNVCRCTLDGHHATCTMKRCEPLKDLNTQSNDLDRVHPEPEADNTFRCNPGEQFKRACNDCTCSADGKSVFCTLRLCDKDISAVI